MILLNDCPLSVIHNMHNEHCGHVSLHKFLTLHALLFFPNRKGLGFGSEWHQGRVKSTIMSLKDNFVAKTVHIQDDNLKLHPEGVF